MVWFVVLGRARYDGTYRSLRGFVPLGGVKYDDETMVVVVRIDWCRVQEGSKMGGWCTLC